MNFLQRNNATLDHSNGLTLVPPSTAYTPIPPQKLLNLQEFTILIHVSSNMSESKGYGSILMCAFDYDHMNFIVGEWKKGIELRIRSANKPNTISFGKKDAFKKGEQFWFAIVYDRSRLILYENGEKKVFRRIGSLTFSNWDSSYPLVIGSDAHGHSFWKGNISSIAIFNKAYPESIIGKLPLCIRDFSPLIYYSFKDSNGVNIKDYGTGIPANLIIPSKFNPYKRAFLNAPYNELKNYSRNLTDIMINLLGFIPLGFFLSMHLIKKNVSLKNSLVISILVGFSISFIIETSQAFLFNRSSSVIDLINNTLGSVSGSLIYNLNGLFRRN